MTDKFPEGGDETAEKVSVTAKLGVPEFCEAFLFGWGIEAETTQVEGDIYIVTAINATKEDLCKALLTQRGTSIIEKK